MNNVKRISAMGLVLISLALVLSGCGSSCDDPSINLDNQTWMFTVIEDTGCYPSPPNVPFSLLTSQSGSTFTGTGDPYHAVNYEGKICGDRVTATGTGIVYNGVAISNIQFTVTGTTATGSLRVSLTEEALVVNSAGSLHAMGVLPPPVIPCSYTAELVGSNTPI